MKTPIKVIREYCVSECMAGSRLFVRLCQATDCPRHPYRMGKNPRRAGIGGNPSFRKATLDGPRPSRIDDASQGRGVGRVSTKVAPQRPRRARKTIHLPVGVWAKIALLADAEGITIVEFIAKVFRQEVSDAKD